MDVGKYFVKIYKNSVRETKRRIYKEFVASDIRRDKK